MNMARNISQHNLPYVTFYCTNIQFYEIIYLLFYTK